MVSAVDRQHDEDRPPRRERAGSPGRCSGASTGTTMKTMNTRLMIRAIASPSNRSRTIATTSTRVTAADAPIATRPAISSGKLPANAHSKAKEA